MLELHLTLTRIRFLSCCSSLLSFRFFLSTFYFSYLPIDFVHFRNSVYVLFRFVLFSFLFQRNCLFLSFSFSFVLFSKIHWFVLINLFIYTQRDANHPDGTSKVSFTIPTHIPFAKLK